jgi:hypothetical protein
MPDLGTKRRTCGRGGVGRRWRMAPERRLRDIAPPQSALQPYQELGIACGEAVLSGRCHRCHLLCVLWLRRLSVAGSSCSEHSSSNEKPFRTLEMPKLEASPSARMAPDGSCGAKRQVLLWKFDVRRGRPHMLRPAGQGDAVSSADYVHPDSNGRSDTGPPGCTGRSGGCAKGRPLVRSAPIGG